MLIMDRFTRLQKIIFSCSPFFLFLLLDLEKQGIIGIFFFVIICLLSYSIYFIVDKNPFTKIIFTKRNIKYYEFFL